jgi:DNA replication protein DnaD
MVKKKKEEAIKEAEKGKEELKLIEAEAGLDMKKVNVDDSKHYSDYDATDDSDIVFK